MTDENNRDLSSSQDSLVDALESIKNLLEKSDSKLAAARESIAIASDQTARGTRDMTEGEQFEIPVLDEVVIPPEAGAATEEVSRISDEISEKIDETLAAVSEAIPVLNEETPGLEPQVLLDYIDTLQKKLEKSLRDSLMKSIVTIEAGLKKTLTEEVDKIREQIKKDFE